MSKFITGDRVVLVNKIKEHTSSCVGLRQYFVIREIKQVEGVTFYIGPRNESYLEEELEFKHIARPKSTPNKKDNKHYKTRSPDL